MPDFECNFDGACEPVNPGGNMGMGAVIFSGLNQPPLVEYSDFEPEHPMNSNNTAEYKAFLWLCERLLSLIPDWPDHIKLMTAKPTVMIQGDSALVIQQMIGKWKMKGGRYMKTAIAAQQKLHEVNVFYRVDLQWIPGPENWYADNLSRRGLVMKKTETT